MDRPDARRLAERHLANNLDRLRVGAHLLADRARYDADQIVAAFAARLKDAVDLASVRDDLAGVVHQTLEPAHLSVWISQHN